MERWEKFTGFIISCVLFLADITFLTKNITVKNASGWIETCQNSGSVKIKELSSLCCLKLKCLHLLEVRNKTFQSCNIILAAQELN